MPAPDPRLAQMFPSLGPEEIDRLQWFGMARRYLFAGVEPATGWPRECGIALDGESFVRTGAGDHQPRPLPLEFSIPGVFAVGDVRSGSAKRVGGAIGEGAAVVAQLHTVLADAPTVA